VRLPILPVFESWRRLPEIRKGVPVNAFKIMGGERMRCAEDGDRAPNLWPDESYAELGSREE